MESREYERLYPHIRDGADFHRLSREYGLPIKSIEAVLLQKIVRETMKNHGRVKARARSLVREWEGGKSFLKIAHENNFPPVMAASIILQEKGVLRRKFAMMLRDLALAKDPRLRRELSAAMKKDLVYSPEGTENMVKRGRRVEERVGEWLSRHGARYHTQEDSQRLGRPKTPDFLLEKPFDVGGVKVHWVECKGSFGDRVEYHRDYRKQFRHYVELFGPGLVVYWYGFLSDLKTEGVTLTSSIFFKSAE